MYRTSSSNLKLQKIKMDKRTIIFVVDKKGNAGKSWFCQYWESVYSDSLYLTPGKRNDMIHAVYSAVRQFKTFFIDVARSTQDTDGKVRIPYEFMEMLKNGIMTNHKYGCGNFRFPVPHVVVMTNQEPDPSMLSEDRMEIYRLD